MTHLDIWDKQQVWRCWNSAAFLRHARIGECTMVRSLRCLRFEKAGGIGMLNWWTLMNIDEQQDQGVTHDSHDHDLGGQRQSSPRRCLVDSTNRNRVTNGFAWFRVPGTSWSRCVAPCETRSWTWSLWNPGGARAGPALRHMGPATQWCCAAQFPAGRMRVAAWQRLPCRPFW